MSYKHNIYSIRGGADSTLQLVLCGLETAGIPKSFTTISTEDASAAFLTLIGERANVAGSRSFARLIAEGQYEQALSAARKQLDEGAHIIDICMDDAMLDAAAEMRTFLRYAAADPAVCKAPFMIDSSQWEVIEAGLRCVQGKPIVNSLSLKEGEPKFIERALRVRQYGAALAVMLFDEQGQADTLERKCAVAERCYRLLTEKAGYPPQDIIFDPNVLAVATGIPQHNAYALYFIEACRWIKSNLPHCKISAGVSNLSFAFRGAGAVRSALHNVFLHRAAQAGLDMAIVNPSTVKALSDAGIASDPLLQMCDNLVLNRSADAAERLIEYALEAKKNAALNGKTIVSVPKQNLRQTLPPAERLRLALIDGNGDNLENDLTDALVEFSAIDIIENVLMGAMQEVGDRFGDGRMFLPQVVKSARILRQAVDILQPSMQGGAPTEADASARRKKPRILLATVKGDVHDIGKNIVGIVLACNGFEVIDLGVMTPLESIMKGIEEHNPDLVGLSGLITPSLAEMERVASAMRERGLRLPLLIGGATTSDLHTALHLDAAYPHCVFHIRDASRVATAARQLASPALKHGYTAAAQQKNETLRRLSQSTQKAETITLNEARANKYVFDLTEDTLTQPVLGIKAEDNADVQSLIPAIDWTMFYYAWGFRGKEADLLQDTERGAAVRRLKDDAERMLASFCENSSLRIRSAAGLFAANAKDEDILLFDAPSGKQIAIVQTQRLLRRMPAGTPNYALADFVAPQGCKAHDCVGAFVLSAEPRDPALLHNYRLAGDEYSALLAETLCHRLAEAYAVQIEARQPARCLRIAIGYSALPDHSQKQTICRLLNASETAGVTLTETYMMQPAAAQCGLFIFNPKAKYF